MNNEAALNPRLTSAQTDRAAGVLLGTACGDALEAAVRGGRDTDTVAAIAGGLLGARWGASAAPLAWQRILHGWPGLRGRDLIALALCTAHHGQSGPDGWPSSRVLDYSRLRRYWRARRPPARPRGSARRRRCRAEAP